MRQRATLQPTCPRESCRLPAKHLAHYLYDVFSWRVTGGGSQPAHDQALYQVLGVVLVSPFCPLKSSH
jgi:hypothetical protein